MENRSFESDVFLVVVVVHCCNIGAGGEDGQGICMGAIGWVLQDSMALGNGNGWQVGFCLYCSVQVKVVLQPNKGSGGPGGVRMCWQPTTKGNRNGIQMGVCLMARGRG